MDNSNILFCSIFIRRYIMNEDSTWVLYVLTLTSVVDTIINIMEHFK